jgi:hypothetical protein
MCWPASLCWARFRPLWHVAEHGSDHWSAIIACVRSQAENALLRNATYVFRLHQEWLVLFLDSVLLMTLWVSTKAVRGHKIMDISPTISTGECGSSTSTVEALLPPDVEVFFVSFHLFWETSANYSNKPSKSPTTNGRHTRVFHYC